MASGVGYYSTGYFATGYWQAAYWAPTGDTGADFWAANYWQANYWATGYWRDVSSGSGDIVVTDDATLSLNTFVGSVFTGPFIQSTTPTLTLSALVPDVEVDRSITSTLASLSLTAISIGVDRSGYVLGDLDLIVSPESAITITYGVVPDEIDVSLTAFHPTTSTPNGLDIGIGNSVDLTATPYVVDAENEIDIQPTPVALTVTGYDSPAAGIGELIRVSLRSMSLAAPTHTITGVSVANIRQSATARLLVSSFTHAVSGRRGLFIPPGTWPPDISITNENAAEHPSNYEICDRTGFRVRRGELVKEWTGLRVRPDSFERRNTQDFVRGVSDEQKGSPAPEQSDRFVSEEHPGGVRASDL